MDLCQSECSLRKLKSFTPSDTLEFAVESIERWWIHEGVKKYLNRNEILIEADAGGSNGYRVETPL
jgi:hypothetical protein